MPLDGLHRNSIGKVPRTTPMAPYLALGHAGYWALRSGAGLIQGSGRVVLNLVACGHAADQDAQSGRDAVPGQRQRPDLDRGVDADRDDGEGAAYAKGKLASDSTRSRPPG